MAFPPLRASNNHLRRTGVKNKLLEAIQIALAIVTLVVSYIVSSLLRAIPFALGLFVLLLIIGYLFY